MPRNTTKAQSRNAQLHALWAAIPDADRKLVNPVFDAYPVAIVYDTQALA